MASQSPTVAARCTGSLKIAEWMASYKNQMLKNYKTCELKVIQEPASWILRICPQANPEHFTDITLSKAGKVYVKEIARRSNMVMFIKMENGSNIQVKDCPGGDKVANLIGDIRNHKAPLTKIAPPPMKISPPPMKISPPPSKTVNLTTSTPREDYKNKKSIVSPGSTARRELGSSPLFTHVKDKVHKEPSHDNDIIFTDENMENVQNRSLPIFEKKNDFLKRASEKSNNSLTSKNFYGGGTPGRNYGSFGTKSASAMKTFSRRPGLLGLVNDKDRPTVDKLNNNLKYSWNPKTSPLVSKELQSTLRGFSNLGNTCYMNAILQSLFGLIPFGDDLMHLASQAMRYQLENHKKSLYFALARLHNAAKKKVANDKQKQFLGDVKLAISSSAKRFSGHEQHDAHEFLSQVIDQIKEDVLKENKQVHNLKAKEDDQDKEKINPTVDDIHHDIAKDRYINPSLLNFEFQIVHTISCLKCNEEVKKIERFNDLSIDFPKRKNADEECTIQDALDQFFQKEQIEYTCEACQHKQVEVSHKFYRAPRVIILHLKRYHFNSITIMNRKLGRNIKIPSYLTLWGHAVDTTYPPYYSHIRESYASRNVLASDENFNNTDIKDDYDILKSSQKKTPGSFTFRRTCKPVTSGPDSENDFDTLRSPNRRTAISKEKGVKEDTDLQEALEQSRMESQESKKQEASFNEYSNGMSEEEQMKLALEQSLQESKEVSKYFKDSTDESKEDNKWPCNIPAEDLDFEERTGSTGNKTVNIDSVDTRQVLPNPRVYQLKQELDESGYQSNNVSFAEDFSLQHSENPVSEQNSYQSPDYHTDTESDKNSESLEPSAKKIRLTPEEDLLSVLDKHEPKVMPEKSKQRLYATPKRLDDLFTKVSHETNSGSSRGECNQKDSTVANDQPECDSVRKDKSCTDGAVSSKKRKPAPPESEFLLLSSDSDCDSNKDSSMTEVKSSRKEQGNIEMDTGEAMSEDRGNMDFNLLGDNTDTSKEKSDNWLTNRTKEEEDTDYKRAIEMSLLDQKSQPLGDAADEDLKKAIENSLKDFTESQGLPWQSDVSEEESFLSEMPSLALSSEDMKKRDENLETGELPFSYRLVSIVSHLGSSSAGHYICDVYNMEEKRWYSFDDSEVSESVEEYVRKCRERSGYIFFYMHKELLEELDSQQKDNPVSKENQENVYKRSPSQEKKTSVNQKTPLRTLNTSRQNNVLLNKKETPSNTRIPLPR